MTVAIKRSKGDIIWFDSVMQFNRQRTASVSKHPLETGSYITDHTTTENPVITISGLITDVDFNLQRPVVSVDDAKANGIQQKPFVNNDPLSNPTVRIESDGGKYSQYIPESVSQFLEDDAPSVSVTPITRSKSAIAIEDDLIQIWKNKEAVTLVEFTGSRINKLYTDCIITSLVFNENADSGDALWPEMTFEQVSYVLSTSVKIPQKVSNAVKNKAAPTNGKGNQAVAPSACNADSSKPTNYSHSNATQLLKLTTSLGNN